MAGKQQKPRPTFPFWALLLHDDEGMLIGLCLSHLAPVGVPLEAVVSHSDGFGLKKPSGEPSEYVPLVAERSLRRRGSEGSER